MNVNVGGKLKKMIIFIIITFFFITVYSTENGNLTIETSIITNITEFDLTNETSVNITDIINITDITEFDLSENVFNETEEITTSEIKENSIDLSLPQVKITPDLSKIKPRIEYVPDEILIKFKKEVLPEKIENILQEFEVNKISKIKKLEVHRLKILSGITVPEMVERLKKNPFVEFVEPNYYAYASMIPNDPLYSYQWHFDNPTYRGIYMEEAWDITTGNSNVIVAVVDTGVAYENYPAPEHCHIDSYRAYGSSGYSWWCGLNEPSWASEPGYGNGWKDYLQRSFDLTTATGTLTFSYRYRHDLEVTAGTPYDKAFTEISTDNGVTWTTLKTYTGNSRVGGTPVAWKAESLDLTSYKGNNTLIRFRVYTDDSYSDEDGLFNSDGAFFVDEIKITDDSSTIFYDNVESGAGTWETTKYKQAPDLAGTSFVAGYDFINNDTHPNDDGGHGTHVAGTIAQTTNNNLGVAGVAFNTTLMPVKVLGSDGSGTYQQVADGIIYAVDNGAKIISMSLGGSSSSTTLKNAVDYAYKKNVSVIAACGNSNIASCDYPAAYGNATAVGATQYDETKAPYSSYGSTLDLVAPGGNTGVDQNGDGYADGVLQQTFGDTPIDFAYWFYQGTSMATPHVSGVAALLLALNSSLTPDNIRNILQSTAEDLGATGWDQYFSYGLINASAAVKAVMPPAEFISITLFGYPIDLGNLDYGTTNNPALGNNQYKIRVDKETTVNIDLYQKGNDFTDSSILGISNMSWYNESNVGLAIPMKKIYENPIATNIIPNTNVSSYYWINIPSGQKAGNYLSTIYIKAVETGTLP